MTLKIIEVDYQNSAQMEMLITLLDHYATDPMGGATALTPQTRQNLPRVLANCPTALSLLAISEDQPAGLTNCFYAVSTFKAAPLLNIHDIVVHQDHRGKGIAKALLQAVQDHARNKGCCKITLEVLSENKRAMSVYQAFGFDNYSLRPETGHALFMEKPL